MILKCPNNDTGRLESTKRATLADGYYTDINGVKYPRYREY